MIAKMGILSDWDASDRDPKVFTSSDDISPDDIVVVKIAVAPENIRILIAPSRMGRRDTIGSLSFSR